MPNAQYFREQADFCLQMARQMSDRKAADNLRDMAAHYQRRALDLESAKRSATAGAPALQQPGMQTAQD
jgi:hypothetical protein